MKASLLEIESDNDQAVIGSLHFRIRNSRQFLVDAKILVTS